MTTAVFIALATLSFIVGGSGTILNFLVCFVYYKKRRLLDASNIFILNIAIGDFSYSIVGLPLAFLSNVRGEWLFGEDGCTAYGFLTAFFALSSIMHLAGSAYERYLTFYGLAQGDQTQFSRKKATSLSILLWFYSLFWSLMPVFGWSSYQQEGIGTSCALNWRSREASDISFALCLILACFVVPVTVIIYCYFKSFELISQLGEYALQNWGQNSPASQEALEAERKMARIAVVVTVGFLVAWTPYAVSSILAMVNPSLINKIAASIPAYIAKSSACYNPLIYAFMHTKLRRNLLDICCCRLAPLQVHPIETV